jgi:hypothetical protein
MQWNGRTANANKTPTKNNSNSKRILLVLKYALPGWTWQVAFGVTTTS